MQHRIAMTGGAGRWSWSCSCATQARGRTPVGEKAARRGANAHIARAHRASVPRIRLAAGPRA